MCEWVNDWMSEGLMQWQYYGINRWQTFRPQSGQSNVFFRRHRRRRRHRHYLLLLLPIHFIPLFHQLNFQPSNCRLISYEIERNVMLHWRFWVPLFLLQKFKASSTLKVMRALSLTLVWHYIRFASYLNRWRIEMIVFDWCGWWWWWWACAIDEASF